MFSYELPFAKTEAHITANMHRLSITTLDCLTILRQSLILTVLKRMRVSNVICYHITLTLKG